MAPLTLSPGAKVAYVVMALIALIGLADATFLTVMHLTGDDSLCGPSSGCSTVLSSTYASVGKVPTAAFGMAAYFVVFSAAICCAFGYPRVRTLLNCLVAVMFVATLGFLYLQAFVLHAYCPFCLLSAALTFLLAGLSVVTPSSR
ncbi:MAG: vitamin K epoxide reductase family protein [Chthoniobacterales bacterium]|nr:vitamin K epoxide reductase family protein [Chthoniobacterales bacterium]